MVVVERGGEAVGLGQDEAEAKVLGVARGEGKYQIARRLGGCGGGGVLALLTRSSLTGAQEGARLEREEAKFVRCEAQPLIGGFASQLEVSDGVVELGGARLGRSPGEKGLDEARASLDVTGLFAKLFTSEFGRSVQDWDGLVGFEAGASDPREIAEGAGETIDGPCAEIGLVQLEESFVDGNGFLERRGGLGLGTDLEEDAAKVFVGGGELEAVQGTGVTCVPEFVSELLVKAKRCLEECGAKGLSLFTPLDGEVFIDRLAETPNGVQGELLAAFGEVA
jgi:hypothetical protein